MGATEARVVVSYSKALSECQDVVCVHHGFSDGDDFSELGHDGYVISVAHGSAIQDSRGVDVGSLQGGFRCMFIDNDSLACLGYLEWALNLNTNGLGDRRILFDLETQSLQSVDEFTG